MGKIGTSHFPAKDTFSAANSKIIIKRQKVQNTGDNVKKVKILFPCQKIIIGTMEKALLKGHFFSLSLFFKCIFMVNRVTPLSMCTIVPRTFPFSSSL
jgi:hypothetical protein